MRTHLMKASGLLNPFGVYSPTGVRRSSRGPWLTALIAMIAFAGLAIWIDGPVGWAFLVFYLVLTGVTSWQYSKWASPPCLVCGYCTMHTADCNYDAMFRKYSANGFYEVS